MLGQCADSEGSKRENVPGATVNNEGWELVENSPAASQADSSEVCSAQPLRVHDSGLQLRLGTCCSPSHLLTDLCVITSQINHLYLNLVSGSAFRETQTKTGIFTESEG